MGILIKRIENKEEVKIIYKYYALFFWILGLMMINAFRIIPAGPVRIFVDIVATTLILLFFVIYLIDTAKYGKEIKKAMRNQGALVTGNKFSFKNPITYTIKK